MVEKLEFIFSRRSVRKYSSDPVSKDGLELLLAAAMSAPSAVAKDPWRFVIVRNKKKLKDIVQALPNGKMLLDADVGILVLGDVNVAHDNQISYLLQDCSAAIENILLAANAIGLGACWIGVHPREVRMKFIQEYFRLPTNIIPVGIVSVGHPAERPAPRNRYNAQYVFWEEFHT